NKRKGGACRGPRSTLGRDDTVIRAITLVARQCALDVAHNPQRGATRDWLSISCHSFSILVLFIGSQFTARLLSPRSRKQNLFHTAQRPRMGQRYMASF